MVIQINFSNKTFFLLVGILVLIGVTGIAIALNSGNPQVHGHTGDEIELRCVNVELYANTGALKINYDSKTRSSTTDLNVNDIAEINTSINTWVGGSAKTKGIAAKNGWHIFGCARSLSAQDEDGQLFEGICGDDTSQYTIGGENSRFFANICKIS